MKTPYLRGKILMVACAAGALGLGFAGACAADDGEKTHIIVPAETVVWKDGPASIPAGAQYAVLEGDPSKAEAFTMRLKLPAGYTIAPHTHPKVERVTVLEGTGNIGLGDTLDKSKGTKLDPGSLFVVPPGHTHYVWSDTEWVLQLNSTGPWQINYVNPDDDPRN